MTWVRGRARCPGQEWEGEGGGRSPHLLRAGHGGAPRGAGHLQLTLAGRGGQRRGGAAAARAQPVCCVVQRRGQRRARCCRRGRRRGRRAGAAAAKGQAAAEQGGEARGAGAPAQRGRQRRGRLRPGDQLADLVHLRLVRGAEPAGGAGPSRARARPSSSHGCNTTRLTLPHSHPRPPHPPLCSQPPTPSPPLTMRRYLTVAALSLASLASASTSACVRPASACGSRAGERDGGGPPEQGRAHAARWDAAHAAAPLRAAACTGTSPPLFCPARLCAPSPAHLLQRRQLAAVPLLLARRQLALVLQLALTPPQRAVQLRAGRGKGRIRARARGQ